MIWRATQADRDGICCMTAGLHCFCQLHCFARVHTHIRTHTEMLECHKTMPRTKNTCTHTDSMQTTLPVAFQLPPGFFLSICGDRMTILPPTTWAESRRTTHMQEHYTRSSTEICRFPAEKQHESCLSNWQDSRRQNKQALLQSTQWHSNLAAPMPFCIINTEKHQVMFWLKRSTNSKCRCAHGAWWAVRRR